MNPRLLLIKLITLLHLELSVQEESSKSSDLVIQLLDTIKLPEIDVGILDGERDIIGGLYNICHKLLEATYETQPAKGDLLQEVRLHAGSDVDLYEAFKEGLSQELSEDGVKARVGSMRKDLKNYLYESLSIKRVFDAANQLRFRRHEIKDINEFLRSHATELESGLEKSSKEDEAILSSIDFSNKESAVKAASHVQKEDTGEGKLKFHLQGLNEMCNGGGKRGELIVTSALPHNNKTGLSLDIFAGVAMNNEPFLFDVRKKPLLVRYSFEDDVEANFSHLFKHLWEQEYGEVATTVDKDPEAIAEYVLNKLQATGWHIKMYKVDPSKWTLFDLFAHMRELMIDYEIALCMTDYLRKMPTTGCIQSGPMGFDVRDMFRRFRNFCNAHRTCAFTPHQIATEAKKIAMATPTGFVKQLPGAGFYDGCRSLDAEIDLEIFQHIEKFNGHSYLTLQRGKHRNAPIISEEKKHLVYPFYDIGGIPPDIGKERSDVKKVGGKVGSHSNEEYDFY